MNFTKIQVRRILAGMLLLSMLSANIACGQSQGDDQTTSNEASETEDTATITSDLPDRDFGNAKFTILQRYVSEGHTHNFFEYDVEEINGEILNDAIYNRNKRIEDRFNVEIGTENAEFAASKAYTEIMAGDSHYNLIADRPTQMTQYTLSGIFTSTDNLPYLDLTKPWWSKNANDSFAINGKLCVFTGDYVLYEKQRLPVMMINLDLAENYGLTDVYDLMKDGKWTFDLLNQYSELATSDLNGDGYISSFDEDQFGIIEGSITYIPFLLFSMNNRFSEKQSDGSYSLTLTTQHMIDSIEKLKGGVFQEGTVWGEIVSAYWTNGITPKYIFEEGRALFYNEVVSIIRTMGGDVRYGILPIPKYDEAQEQYLTTVQYDNSGAIGVPISLSKEELEMKSILLEALCEDSHTSTLPAFIEGVMQSKKAPDEESIESLKLIFDTNNIVYDMFAAYNIGDLNNLVSNEIYDNKGDSFVSVMDANKEAIIASYETVIETFKDLENSGN